MALTRQETDVTDLQFCSISKTKLSCHDRFDMLWYVTKNRQDNDVTNHTNVVYDEIETKGS